MEAVATFVKNNYSTTYDESVMDEIERKAAQTGSAKSAAPDPEPNAEELTGDEMLPQAVDVILETGQASVSMLQRRLNWATPVPPVLWMKWRKKASLAPSRVVNPGLF